MTPRLPGTWLTVPSSVAVTKMTSTGTKSTAGLCGSKAYIAAVTRQRSTAPMPVWTKVRRTVGNTSFQLA